MSPHRLTRLALIVGPVIGLVSIGLFLLNNHDRNQTADVTKPASDAQAWAAAQVVDHLPSFALPDLSGQMRNIESWQGDLLILNVWATWCAPCREEIPVLIEAQDRYGSQGVTVIGLTLDQTEPTKAFADAFGINYPLLIDDSDQRDVLYQLGSHALGVPHTFIIDRNGAIVDFHLGIMSAQTLDDRISPRLTSQ